MTSLALLLSVVSQSAAFSFSGALSLPTLVDTVPGRVAAVIGGQNAPTGG